MRIKSNKLVVSSYYNELNWITQYVDDFTLYDKSKVNVGYNISDYFTYIIDHYDSLPDVVIFMKGNLLPRHVTKNYWESIMNNTTFTPIEDRSLLKIDGINSIWMDGYWEVNHNWFAYKYKIHPVKYFNTINELFRFVYKVPPTPQHIRFAPGANYIVPKENILKLPKILYEILRECVSHHQLSAESHIVERALYTLWTSDQKLNEFTTQSISSWNWTFSRLDLPHSMPLWTDS